jgi:hypothetical protein
MSVYTETTDDSRHARGVTSRRGGRCRGAAASATDDLPVPVNDGRAHVKLETIHPLLEGDGRGERLLVTFFLCHAGILRDPLLSLSLYVKQHRQDYYAFLDGVRRDGDRRGSGGDCATARVTVQRGPCKVRAEGAEGRFGTAPCTTRSRRVRFSPPGSRSPRRS